MNEQNYWLQTLDRRKLGDRINEVRTRSGLSMEKLAHAIGRSSTHIADIENGKSSPSAEDLYNICLVCDTNFNYLFRDSIDYEKIDRERREADAEHLLNMLSTKLPVTANRFRNSDDRIPESLGRLAAAGENLAKVLTSLADALQLEKEP